MIDARYYSDKLLTLADLFGAEVGVDGSNIVVGKVTYPVVDDVIILLDPADRPASLRRGEPHGIGQPGWQRAWKD